MAGRASARRPWGRMVADGRRPVVSAGWISLFPGLAITLTALSLTLPGDWRRDRPDPGPGPV